MHPASVVRRLVFRFRPGFASQTIQAHPTPPPTLLPTPRTRKSLGYLAAIGIHQRPLILAQARQDGDFGLRAVSPTSIVSAIPLLLVPLRRGFRAALPIDLPGCIRELNRCVAGEFVRTVGKRDDLSNGLRSVRKSRTHRHRARRSREQNECSVLGFVGVIAFELPDAVARSALSRGKSRVFSGLGGRAAFVKR